MYALVLLAVSMFAASASALAASQSCYWNGAPAGKMIACDSDPSSFGSCCPTTDANEYYPLDYPNCTPEGLCKAGNSNYKARGACADKDWNSPACSGYCRHGNSFGMAGLTDCGTGGPWYCCNSDHDSGACSCSPPSGTAFLLTGGPIPLFYSSLANNASASAIFVSLTASSAAAVSSSSSSASSASSASSVSVSSSVRGTSVTPSSAVGTAISTSGAALTVTSIVQPSAQPTSTPSGSPNSRKSTVTVFVTASPSSTANLGAVSTAGGATRNPDAVWAPAMMVAVGVLFA